MRAWYTCPSPDLQHIANVVDHLSFLVQSSMVIQSRYPSCQGFILLETNRKMASEVTLSFMYGQHGLHSVLNLSYRNWQIIPRSKH